MTASHLEAKRFHNGPLFLDLRARHFVRRQDRYHFFYSLSRFQGLFGAVAFLAKGSDHGAFRADDDMAAQSQLLNTLDHVIDLVLCGVRFHDDNHGYVPLSIGAIKKESPETSGGLR